jgi:hypothetical protein
MSSRGRYPFLWLGAPLVLILLFAFGPLALLLAGGVVADALGCTMPISAIAPCPFMGFDLAGLLAVAVAFGYFAFVTVPAGTTALAVWFVVAVAVTLAWWLRRRRTT